MHDDTLHHGAARPELGPRHDDARSHRALPQVRPAMTELDLLVMQQACAQGPTIRLALLRTLPISRNRNVAVSALRRLLADGLLERPRKGVYGLTAVGRPTLTGPTHRFTSRDGEDR